MLMLGSTPASTLAVQPSADHRTPTPPEHRIGIRMVDGRAEFFDRATGSRFVPRGADHVFVPAGDGRVRIDLLRVGAYDPVQVRADLGALAASGYDSVRVFIDHCSSGPGCIGDDDGVGLSRAYLDDLADLLAASAETGLEVLLTSNDLPDLGGYADEANAGSGATFAGYRNSYYLTPGAVSASRRYWQDLVGGLIERRARTDVVLGWELVNEQWMFADQPPLSLRSGSVTTTTGTYDMSSEEDRHRMVDDGLVHYIAEVRGAILALDPTALVTMGFFVPDLVAPGWYVRTAPLIERSDLDFFDFHAYPGPITLREHAEHFGMVGFDDKPIVMGEVGAFRARYPSSDAAATAVASWIAESCALGFDGWFYWASRSANPEVSDGTWGLLDDQGELLRRLSPSAQPDPCAEPADLNPDLGTGRPVRASAWRPDEPPRLAVDGSEETSWGSGADPVQWIEVDLGGRRTVAEVRLLVAQFPAGRTRHVVEARTPQGLRRIGVAAGRTKDGDWLIVRARRPLRGVTAVRVTTTASPSWVAWREVQVYAQRSERGS